MATKKKKSSVLQNPLNSKPFQPEELKQSTDSTPKVNPYEYAVEDLRHRQDSDTVSITNLGSQAATWTAEFDLSEEEIQFIYFWASTTNINTFSDSLFSYTVYIDGIRYVTVPTTNIFVTTDIFINVLNSVRVLTSRHIKLEVYCSRASSPIPAPTAVTMNFAVKTIK